MTIRLLKWCSMLEPAPAEYWQGSGDLVLDLWPTGFQAYEMNF